MASRQSSRKLPDRALSEDRETGSSPSSSATPLVMRPGASAQAHDRHGGDRLAGAPDSPTMPRPTRPWPTAMSIDRNGAEDFAAHKNPSSGSATSSTAPGDGVPLPACPQSMNPRCRHRPVSEPDFSLDQQLAHAVAEQVECSFTKAAEDQSDLEMIDIMRRGEQDLGGRRPSSRAEIGLRRACAPRPENERPAGLRGSSADPWSTW